ncbi:alpha/beta hydrolase fold domain-containing protein [Streptomyces sp. S1D4-11]
MPAAIVAFSPGLDMTRTGESMDTKAGIDPFFTREGLEHTGTMYLAGQDPHQPMLSPATLADLTGFPPMLLQAGTNEILLDDSTRMATRARDAGVDVILDITADVPHVFQAFAKRPGRSRRGTGPRRSLSQSAHPHQGHGTHVGRLKPAGGLIRTTVRTPGPGSPFLFLAA